MGTATPVTPAPVPGRSTSSTPRQGRITAIRRTWTATADVDVVMALRAPDRPGIEGRDQIVWYENEGTPEVGPWEKHVIAESFPKAFEAVAGDIDGDGQTEVVATAWGDDGRIALFKHNGDPRGPWRMQVLKEGWANATQVLLVDLDSDGRLDIAASAERGSNEVRWWRNEGPAAT